MVRRRGAALAGAALALAASAARAAEPACTARASLEPARAVVGQQVRLSVYIETREDVTHVEWARRPSFPGIRVEPLQGQPGPSYTGADGSRYRSRIEQRALFPQQSGAHRLRTEGLRCTVPGVGTLAVPLAPPTLRVEDPPADGRPADFAGVVGPLTVRVNVSPRQVALGETVRVAVVIRGAGDLWNVPAPFDAASFGGAEVFALAPRLLLDRGSQLTLRQHFAWDVVPRRPAALVVPALRLPFFDPRRGVFAEATSAPVEVAVDPRPPDADPRRDRTPSQRPEIEGGPGPSFRALALGVAAVGLAALAIAWRLRRRRGAGPDPGSALREAEAARARGDGPGEAEALTRALRAALAHHVDDAASLTPEDLMARAGLPPAVSAAAHLLASLERSRFDPAAPPPDAGAVARCVASLN